jgi:DegV family protein with EDD domain
MLVHLWRVLIWSNKLADFGFIDSIVRANKSGVNDRKMGHKMRYFVNYGTIVAESEYNGIDKGVYMADVAVVTDSCASIPEGLLERLHIRTVAYYIHRGQEVLRDLVTIQREEFVHWLLTARFLPTTASPGPGDYFDAYRELANEGKKEIISIQMSSKVSGGYQAATVAQSMMQDEFPDVHIEVVDTQNAALCQGWMVIESAHGALAGLSLDRLVDTVKRMIPISGMIQTADTLKYLCMGGRIGKAQELLGSMLSIKPLIGLEDGVIVPLGKARSRGQAYQQMADMVAKVVGEGKAKIAYVHVGAQREVERLRELIEARVHVVESFVGELSPALAVHSGPGTTGLCYYPVD